MLQYLHSNILKGESQIKQDLRGERIIDDNHLYTVVHSESLDCNPHANVEYVNLDITTKVIDHYFVAFVPSTAKSQIPLPPNGMRNVIIDIRSAKLRGKTVFDVFRNYINAGHVTAKTSAGKHGKIYFSNCNISDNEVFDSLPSDLSKLKITVLLDRYSLSQLDEYCSIALHYFYKHFKVKGKPHKMYNYIFKEIRVGKEEKITFSLPVLKLK
jgi:hypothetical protein